MRNVVYVLSQTQMCVDRIPANLISFWSVVTVWYLHRRDIKAQYDTFWPPLTTHHASALFRFTSICYTRPFIYACWIKSINMPPPILCKGLYTFQISNIWIWQSRRVKGVYSSSNPQNWLRPAIMYPQLSPVDLLTLTFLALPDKIDLMIKFM